MSEVIPPRYNFSETEKQIYQKWLDKGCFNAALAPDGTVLDEERAKAETYTIAIPPPNVTGRLHMGHALNNTIQDMLIRYKRMCGYDALWIPGTDHAGIATQTVVKKMLDQQGIDYREIGREKFVEYVWEWKEKYGNVILDQLRKMGCSCNWERTRFTMDEGLSRAVNRSFKKLYDEGLIYQGTRIVNWCPVDRTALSDDEVETKEGGESGHLWHIKYPVVGGSDEFLIVATTRPETLFGDVAVAVHPEDERYQKYIGKKVHLPLTDREIPVIADDYVDKDFGTGCLKITPAHDPNDFEVGNRHNFTPINVMNEDATMNDEVPEAYRGLDRYKCRREAVKHLKEQELLDKEQKYKVPLGRSYRSKEVIEYRLSKQWFVKMDSLAKMALERHSELNIQPERWNKVYFHWLNNIRDWCISRQIWWGHRIPAWYHKETGEVLVSEETPQQVLDHPDAWRQEEDVLDTWFSSALWPMSTLGWPQHSSDFKRYFPTATLSTAKDIIFFWVARMNFSALKFEDTFPYKNVYIHPTILDAKGETMSKSKGNGIDPLVVIDGATIEDLKKPVNEARPSDMKKRLKEIEKNFPEGFEAAGADAMRYTLLHQCSTGQEIRLSLNTFYDIGRRFMTKLWNAARFIFMYIDQEKDSNSPEDFTQHLSDEDLWMQGKIQLATNKLRENMDTYDFSHLGEIYYQLIWNDFCDWYVELCKARLTSEDDIQRKTALHSLITSFADILRLFHPIVPFITEELWSKLLEIGNKNNLWGTKRPQSELIIVERFPESQEPEDSLQKIIAKFNKLQDIVTLVRTLRADYTIKPAQKICAYILAKNDLAKSLLADKESHRSIIRLANLESLEILENENQKPQKTVTLLDSSCEVYVDIHEFVDVDKELERLQKEMQQVEKYIASITKKLDNRNFVERAKPEIVAAERAKAQENQEKLDKLKYLHKQFANF